ncbi:respiratory nitrate reductase subunit gamma [Chloroflexota bacterium]
MEGTLWLQIATYVFCVLVVVILVAKFLRYAKISTHLRWELYPLAGEKNRPSGGSYLEESEWWVNPSREKSFLGEIKFMGQEILFFREYFRLNRNYWFFVYPFHIGVFLFAIFLVLLLIGAITALSNVSVSAESVNAWGIFLHYTTLITGGISLVLGALGCIALLIRRGTDNNLKPYTKRKDYFNLLFVLVVFLTGFFSWLLVDLTFSTAREYVHSLITFSPMANMEPITIFHIILILLLAAYMPFTNIMHFFAKWFTYHKVRWDDEPNLRGSNLEKSLGSVLNQPLSWSAPHTQPIMHWSDIARITTEEEHAPRIKKG